ncbi:MAG TPA: DUF4398 domain-containing protein [Polyangia bacterium]|jgi:hypothetical protein|nr:DUF4398 domain-containing protein [Polyangia bacterium]
MAGNAASRKNTGFAHIADKLAAQDVRVIDQLNASCYRRPGLRQVRTLPTGSIVVLLAPLLVSSVGCGPVEYINQVGNKAASAVSAAKLASAERYAPYEYTKAEEYLHKAREEAGHAEYEDAIEYGRKAEEFANRARAITVERMAKESAATVYQPKTQNEEPRAAPAEDPGAAQKPAPARDEKAPE